jgi:hypothetical protein
MDKSWLTERIVKQTLDNRGKVLFLFSGNKEKMKNFFHETMRIFRKKICEGYDVSADYYLIDFYTYMMICKDWSIIELHNELLNCERCHMAITKHLKEINSDLLKNQVVTFLEKYKIGL